MEAPSRSRLTGASRGNAKDRESVLDPVHVGSTRPPDPGSDSRSATGSIPWPETSHRGRIPPAPTAATTAMRRSEGSSRPGRQARLELPGCVPHRRSAKFAAPRDRAADRGPWTHTSDPPGTRTAPRSVSASTTNGCRGGVFAHAEARPASAPPRRSLTFFTSSYWARARRGKSPRRAGGTAGTGCPRSTQMSIIRFRRTGVRRGSPRIRSSSPTTSSEHVDLAIEELPIRFGLDGVFGPYVHDVTSCSWPRRWTRPIRCYDPKWIPRSRIPRTVRAKLKFGPRLRFGAQEDVGVPRNVPHRRVPFARREAPW